MARVSSDEQAKGYSLDVQEDALRMYCNKHSLHIVRVVREDYSAKTFKRPEFQKLLKDISSRKLKVDQLLFTTWDRFSRNTTESYAMIARLKAKKVIVQAIEQPIDISIPENKAMLAFYLAIPEIDNDRRSLKVRGGIRGARKEGRWLNRAPFGYANEKDEKKRPIIVPNENAMYVKYAFNSIANGKTQRQVQLDINHMGCNLSKTALSKLLRMQVYAGLIWVPEYEDEEGFFTKGLHKPLIDMLTFEKVQNIISGKQIENNKPNTTSKKAELPLRGVLVCSKCGHHITGSASRSKTGKKHYYYHCNSCRKERFRADEVNSIIDKILKEFELSDDLKRLYKEVLQEKYNATFKETENRYKLVEESLTKIKKRIENTNDLLADGKIDLETYSIMILRYKKEQSETKVELSNLANKKKISKKKISDAIQSVSDMAKIYAMSSVEQKNAMIQYVFPEKFSYDGNKCRTQTINGFMYEIASVNGGLQGIKKGQNDKKINLSSLVGDEGVEPPTLWV